MNESASLQQRLTSMTERSTERVDVMNDLAALLENTYPEESAQWATQAADEARWLQYREGERRAFLQAAAACKALRKFAEAARLYEQALALGEGQEGDPQTADIFKKMGTVQLYAGKYNEALESYNRALRIFENTTNELAAADLYANSGVIRGLQGSYVLALKNHLQALRIFEKLGEQQRIASSCSNIGIIYYEQQNYGQALQMYERALEIRERLSDLKSVSEVMNNIGNVYHRQQKFSEALDMHQRALQLREQSGDKVKIATSYSNLADVYKATQDYTTALDFYQHAVDLFEQENENRGLIPAYFNIAELYFIIGQYDQAEPYFNMAITMAEQTGLKDHLRETYEYMAKLHAIRGNFEQAYRAHLRYAELDKEISNAETSRQIARITVSHEIEQKEREAELEKVKNLELTKAYQSLDEEKKRSDSLLLNILPEPIAEELKQTGKATARLYDEVTVMFTDFVGFTKVSMLLTPQQLVNELHECFKVFDAIIAKYRIEKIKTIGDAYMAVSGMPVPNAHHAADMVSAALEIREFMLARKQQLGEATFEVRLGIHSGSVVAGIVGVTKFAYDVWGDTVNTAARMEQHSIPGKVNVSQTTFDILHRTCGDRFIFEYRGEIEAKNKGKLKMYFAT